MQRMTAADSQPDRAKRDYRLLMEEVTSCAVLVLDPGGYVVGWNAGAQRLLGYREDEVRGEHFSRLFFRPEEVWRGEHEDELNRAAAHDRVSGDRWYTRKDGTAVWCNGITTALRNQARYLLGFAVVLGDRSALKQLPSPSEQTQAAGNDFLARELRHLVVIIHSCKELLLDRLGLADPTMAQGVAETSAAPGSGWLPGCELSADRVRGQGRVK